MRVAFATTRGTTIDEHFGRAALFAVWDITAQGASLRELREVADGDYDLEVVVTRGAGAVHDSAVERKIGKLDDCRIVYFTEIGGPAAAKLVQHGIMPLKAESGSPIATAASALAERARTNPPPWMRKTLAEENAD
jgi:nitrogen fixation protein NifX